MPPRADIGVSRSVRSEQATRLDGLWGQFSPGRSGQRCTNAWPQEARIQPEVDGKPQRAEQVALFWEGMQNGQLDREGSGEQRQLEAWVPSVGFLQKSDLESLP